jgi:signal peptidase I
MTLLVAIASVGPLLALTGTAVLARRTLVRIEVVGESMSPTLRSGEFVIATRRRASPRVGEIWVFEAHTASDVPLLVKRVSAVAGDRVPARVCHLYPEVPTVPAGQVVVDGDARSSLGSAEIGFVPVSALVARVWAPNSRGIQRPRQLGCPSQ